MPPSQADMDRNHEDSCFDEDDNDNSNVELNKREDQRAAQTE